MANQSPPTNDKSLTTAERRHLTNLVSEHGEDHVREVLGVGKLPMARLLAGLPVLRATVAVARAGLAKLANEEANR